MMIIAQEIQMKMYSVWIPFVSMIPQHESDSLTESDSLNQMNYVQGNHPVTDQHQQLRGCKKNNRNW